MILEKSFFLSPATVIAPALIGKLLCVKRESEIIRLRITETECYFGEEDTACHASKGRTKRTETLYSEGGVAYVYLCYGMYDMLNFVTGARDHPEAVLIRAIKGVYGPGRLTKRLEITRQSNGNPLDEAHGLWVEDDGTSLPFSASGRIGINYANESDRQKLWRFTAII